MTSSIAAIHSLSKKLGLDDDTRRAKMRVITGEISTKAMTEEQRQLVVKELKAELGQLPRTRPKADRASGKYAPKLQALWIAGWNLGVIKDRTDAAMISFVKSQAKVDHTRFLHDHDDATKAIEGLKGWLNGKAKVGFGNTNGYDWLKPHGAKIAWAQWRILNPTASLVIRMGFDEAVFKILDLQPVYLDRVSPGQWQTVMNALGERVRAKKKAGSL